MHRRRLPEGQRLERQQLLPEQLRLVQRVERRQRQQLVRQWLELLAEQRLVRQRFERAALLVERFRSFASGPASAGWGRGLVLRPGGKIPRWQADPLG